MFEPQNLVIPEEESNLDKFEQETLFGLDVFLIFFSIFFIVLYFFYKDFSSVALAVIAFIGLAPVLYSAVKSILEKQISVDLLASVALVFSLISHEWFSASFITLMLAFARIFDRITDAKAKKIIKSLLKYHVENVRVRIGETIKEIHISQIKPGDQVIVEAGDRMPVDGTVISGMADVDESSLTGESEPVAKKNGSKVFTSTVNLAGSLVVRTERVGKDSTLAKIISLVEEASRDKSRAERVANKFTGWYISIAFLVSVTLYIVGISPKIILAILLVVCADDIAVAVPLSFTAAIARMARRGIIVKGSAALEQLSRIKYILTDKTGTLTKGKPKIFGMKAYGKFSIDFVTELFGMGASESRHPVSKAVLSYLEEKKLRIHAPHESREIPGQGVYFRHDNDVMYFGRSSFMENKKIVISPLIKTDISIEKEAGRGVALLSINGEVAGLLSYRDELRPRVKEIIEETRMLGIGEWHMLTGDNEKSAGTISDELGIKHHHSNMTPESKVEFIRNFEREHKKDGLVAYIGDGVNDAASLALVDVSVAMGGIGSDAAIEASDITIMHDHLNRLPEVLRTAKQVRGIMYQCFAIWSVTNAVGLGLVMIGVLGPAEAAAYNFITDFIPIANALRAGKK